MSYINLAAIRTCTVSEGPGKRFALWVQGCERRCSGCCNPEMQPFVRKTVVDSDNVISLIKQAHNDFGVEGVSFIGGEPILQAEGLADIAEWCRGNGITVLVFTGYLYESLMQMHNSQVERLMRATDILVDGEFVVEEIDIDRDWIGSKNQRVHFLSNKYSPGVEYQNGGRSMEVMVSNDSIMVNGWPFDV